MNTTPLDFPAPTPSPTHGFSTESYGSFVHRRRTSVGLRKRSPESLVDLDAPTQPRNYTTPSVTSRKAIPAFFTKRRGRSHPSEEEDEEDELTEEPPAANATDQEHIEWKRRQNTLAARRSRQRRQLHQQRLEETVERLTVEKEVWRTRALTLRQLLRSQGIPYPDFTD